MTINTPSRSITAAAMFITACLAACGGGGDAASEASAESGELAALCDTSLFSGGVATPTLEQATPFAGTYSGEEGSYSSDFVTFTKTGDATLLANSDGSVVYKGSRVDIKSVCYEAATNTLYLHWGTKTVVGEGAVYDNHVDLKNGGSNFSGFINGLVFRKPVAAS